MMDAFAADRKLGEGVGIAYVLAGTSEAKRKEDMAAWDAKGVIPVLYEDAENHQALHLTLAKWAACHQNGLFGKESIVRDCASSALLSRSMTIPEVSQVLWALSETTGHIAQFSPISIPFPRSNG